MKKIIATFAVAAATLGADAALKTTWDVGDYIQTDIIAHFDGIRNMGADQPHDSTTTRWTNLVAGTCGEYATLNTAKGIDGDHAAVPGEWTDKGYIFRGYNRFATAGNLELGDQFTVQVVCDIDMADFGDGVHTMHKVWSSEDGGGTIALWLDRSYAGAIAGNTLYLAANTYKGDSARPQFTWSGKYINAAFDNTYAYIGEEPCWNLVDWGYRRAKTLESAKPVPAMQYSWGGKYRSGNVCDYYCKGTIFAWRAYSRRLDDSELAWNRAIDEIRYHGASAPPVTNVVIAADALGRYGAEPAGVYVVDGSHTFVASNVIVGGGTYAATGYTLETWDAATGAWGAAVAHEGSSFTYDTATTSAKVRIAWKWRMVVGIERFDVGHYVQDGLIAQYDGIRNMGADLPHDSTSTTWANLVADGRDGSLHNMKGINGEACPAPGEWTDTGYRFYGYSYFEMADTLELGSNFTVQIVSDIDSSDFADGVHKYQTIFSTASGDSVSFWLDRSSAGAIAGSNLTFKVDKYNNGGGTGARPNITSWDGRYANLAFDDTHSHATEHAWWYTDSTWGRTRAHGALLPIPALKYSWGGRYGTSYSPAVCCKGLFYSWRAYSRMLTDAELAWNRDIDEVRYHDGLPKSISNAVVVVSARDGFAAAESGVYLLTDSYTFTAAQRRIGRALYLPEYAVEAWDAASEEWLVLRKAQAGAVTLRQAESTVPRRIVWNWRKQGFVIIMR